MCNDEQFIDEMYKRVMPIYADGPIRGETYCRLYRREVKTKIKRDPVIKYLRVFLVVLSFILVGLLFQGPQSKPDISLATMVVAHRYYDKGLLVTHHKLTLQSTAAKR